MNKIWLALTAAIAATMGVIFTPIVVTWVMVVLLAWLISGGTASGILELHKRLFIKPPVHLTLYGKPLRQRDYWHTEVGKTCIRVWAFVYGWLFTTVSGVVCWLLIPPETLGHDRQVAAIVILWEIGACLVGGALPRAYQVTKRYLAPWLARRMDLPAPDADTGDDVTVIPDELLRRKDHVD